MVGNFTTVDLRFVDTSSLVTGLRAAKQFDKSRLLSSPAVAPTIDTAQVFYVEGYGAV